MIKRFLKKELIEYMQQFPAVALLGARQTGKTTLAKDIARYLKRKVAYFDLEKNSDRKKLSDIETILSELQEKCVIIDEAQSMPELFTALRPLIDEYRRPGRFLLLGSVSPHLVKNISETLAGRIGYLELGTITLLEALKHKINLKRIWFRGGYPDALLSKNDIQFFRWAENYYRNFAERDVHFLTGESLSPTLVKKIWNMLAGVNGTVWNGEQLSRSLGISRHTLSKYADFLEGAFLINRLQPWFINIKKRIVKSPKVYFRDTGLLHYLCQIHSESELYGNIVIGGSWEAFTIEQIRQLKPYRLSMYYYRTHHGAEADVVLVKGQKAVACVEIKLNNAPDIPRGFHEVIRDLKTMSNYVITPESDEYSGGENITVCNIEVFLKKYLPIIGK